MEDIIDSLMTPEDCVEFAHKCNDLAKKAYRRAIELRALTHGTRPIVEAELFKAVYAYEEILSRRNKRRTPASRTRQMINRYGIIETAERAVNRKIESMGYNALVEMGLQDLSFESVMLRFPESFSAEAVEKARLRMEELKNYKQ